tara:strand:+ start:8135 stop:8629 length:495 start_codon:yes stop_codon:yes gene_type:complete
LKKLKIIFDFMSRPLTKILIYFLIFLMGFMVFTVTWQIFTRFILNDPSLYSEEVAGFLLIWIGMLGSTYALLEKSHIGIDVVTKNFIGKEKAMSEIFIYSIIILFSFFVLVIGGLRLVYITLSLNQISPALGIKMAYIYLVVPISGMMMIVFSIDFIKKIMQEN